MAVFDDGLIQFLDGQGKIAGKTKFSGIESVRRASIGRNGNILFEQATNGDVYLGRCSNSNASEGNECPVRKIETGPLKAGARLTQLQ